MQGLVSLLLFAAFFYLMMRFGCGAHMVHGDHVATPVTEQTWVRAWLAAPLKIPFAAWRFSPGRGTPK